jgi:hypothetical protein
MRTNFSFFDGLQLRVLILSWKGILILLEGERYRFEFLR